MTRFAATFAKQPQMGWHGFAGSHRVSLANLNRLLSISADKPSALSADRYMERPRPGKLEATHNA